MLASSLVALECMASAWCTTTRACVMRNPAAVDADLTLLCCRTGHNGRSAKMQAGNGGIKYKRWRFLPTDPLRQTFSPLTPKLQAAISRPFPRTV